MTLSAVAVRWSKQMRFFKSPAFREVAVIHHASAASQLDDQLGVLASTLPVVERAAWVAIDHDRIEAVATDLAAITADPTPWVHPLHFTDPDNPDRTAAWVFVLDALNFCFWSEEPDVRWRVE